jgi:hypothetical protein
LAQGFNFILVYKPDSHVALYAQEVFQFETSGCLSPCPYGYINDGVFESDDFGQEILFMAHSLH